MSIAKSNSQKDISLEVMRVIAMFFVIFNHTQEHGFVLFSTYEPNSVQFWLYMPISILCKFSVPLFFMISGALLLKREEDLKTLFTKRILRILITTLVISAGYYILDIAKGVIPYYGTANVLDFFIFLFSGKIRIHLWFLYSYLAFLVLLPFIRKITKAINKQEFRYLFCIAAFIMIFRPIFESLLFDDFQLQKAFGILTTNIFIYPLLGYYLYHFVDINTITKFKLAIGWIIDFILLIPSCLFTFYKFAETGELSEAEAQEFFGMFEMYNASIFFITVKKNIPTIKNKIVNTAIAYMGECTFGIYLLHILVMDIYYIDEFQEALQLTSIAPMLSCLIYCLIIFAISFGISFIIKKIPIAKNLI